MINWRTFTDFLLKSGFTANSKKIAGFFLQRKPLMKLLRFKVDPGILLNNDFDPDNFSMMISEISVGPAFKTTGYERHNSSDDIIHRYARAYPKLKHVVDIGVSDGTSALYLIRKLKNIPGVTINLYDKYTHLNSYRKWYGNIYSNQDNRIVYIKAFFLLLYVYPVKCIINSSNARKIPFDNPKIKDLQLNVEYFDIFKTRLETQVDFIKCANVLNPVYFSPEEIRLALRNLYDNMVDGGYLFIIHNTKANESLLVLRKAGDELLLERNISNSDLPEYIEITDSFNMKK